MCAVIIQRGSIRKLYTSNFNIVMLDFLPFLWSLINKKNSQYYEYIVEAKSSQNDTVLVLVYSYIPIFRPGSRPRKRGHVKVSMSLLIWLHFCLASYGFLRHVKQDKTRGHQKKRKKKSLFFFFNRLSSSTFQMITIIKQTKSPAGKWGL